MELISYFKKCMGVLCHSLPKPMFLSSHIAKSNKFYRKARPLLRQLLWAMGILPRSAERLNISHVISSTTAFERNFSMAHVINPSDLCQVDFCPVRKDTFFFNFFFSFLFIWLYRDFNSRHSDAETFLPIDNCPGPSSRCGNTLWFILLELQRASDSPQS